MSNRILITGATGFVGSHIAEAFLEAGYELRCGVRDPARPRWLAGLPVETVPLDLTNPTNLRRALEGVTTVVHAAGITRARRPRDYERVNAVGTRRLADAALQAGVRRFVLISSLAACGPDGMNHPASAYGWSKRRAETYLRTFSKNMEIVVLRPAAVYGPRDTDLLPLFALAKKGWLVVPAGPGPLQPVYATDVAGAALAAAREPLVDSRPLPVAENVSYSWERVIRTLEKVEGRSIQAVRLPAAGFRFGGRVAEWVARIADKTPAFDVRRAEDLAFNTWTCDTSPSQKTLRWSSEVPLAEGLGRTARWYEEKGWI